MCRIASLFLLQRLKGNMSGDARDFNNIETRAVIKFFSMYFMFNSVFPKIVPFMRKCGKIYQSRTDYIWQHGACSLHAVFLRLHTHTHILRICNNYFFATAKMVKRELLKFTLYAHWVSFSFIQCTDCLICKVERELLYRNLGMLYCRRGAPCSNPGKGYVRFVVDEMALGEIFLQVLQHSSVRIIPPVIYDNLHLTFVLTSGQKSGTSKPSTRQRSFWNRGSLERQGLWLLFRQSI